MIPPPSLRSRMLDSSGRRLFDPRSRIASRRLQRGFIVNPYAFGAAINDNGGPNAASRVLALDMEGTTTSYTDNSASALTVTAAGTATQTSAQAQFGSKSTEFAASASDYLDIAANAVFSLTTFTLQFWVRFPSAPASGAGAALVDLGSYITGFSLRYNVGNNNVFVYYNSGVNTASGSFTWPATTWTHVAMTRDSVNTLRMFVDGIKLTENASVTTVMSSPAVRIGYILAGGVSSTPQKWIDDLTVANTCWWNTDFTPPTSALAGP